MTKTGFYNRVLLSSLLVLVAVAVTVVFSAYMFLQYSPPTEQNTSVLRGTVTEVYATSPVHTVEIVMSDGEALALVSPYGLGSLYEAIGYDIDELAYLLEGRSVQYRRMNDLPWVLEIRTAQTQINNGALTAAQITVTRVAIVAVGLCMLVLTAVADVSYIKTQYARYTGAERKRAKKSKARTAKGPKTRRNHVTVKTN